MADCMIRESKVGTLVHVKGDGGDCVTFVIHPDRKAHMRTTTHNNGGRQKSWKHLPNPKPQLRRLLCPDWAEANGLGWAFPM